MGKLNNFQLINGYFYVGLWEEYDKETKTYKDPIEIRYKQNDEGTQGVSSSGKATKMLQDSQGRPIYKKVFTIKVLDDLPFKGRDRFTIKRSNESFMVVDKFEDYASVNSINNLQFPKLTKNLPKVLILGQA